MYLQISKNNWSCTAVSAAMVLGVPVERIYDLCGHDGSGFPWPAPFQHVRAGFHMHEIIDITWMQFGLPVTPFSRRPMASPSPDCPEVPVNCPDGIFPELRFTRRLQGRRGVLTGTLGVGRQHAVAWGTDHIYDPRGYRYRYQDRDSYSFEPDTFWMFGGLDAGPFTTLP